MGKATIQGWVEVDYSKGVDVTILPRGGRGVPPNDDIKRYEFSRVGLWVVFAYNAFLLCIAATVFVMVTAAFFFVNFRRNEVYEMLAMLAVSGLAAWFFFKSSRNLFREVRNPGHQVAIAGSSVSIRAFTGMKFSEYVVRYDELGALHFTEDLPFITFDSSSVFSGCRNWRGRHLTAFELASSDAGSWFDLRYLGNGLKLVHLAEIVREITRRAPRVAVKKHSTARGLSHHLFGG